MIQCSWIVQAGLRLAVLLGGTPESARWLISPVGAA